jgi:hypothetical protein
MSDVDRDPLVRRAIDELRKTPRADHETVARVVAAAAAARVTPADDEPTLPDRARRARLWTLGGVAAAAAVAGFALSSANGVRRERAAMAAAAAAPVANAPAPEFQPVGSNSADGLPVLRQFVFHSRTAHSVSVVGDFNRWSSESNRMTRAADGDLWSVTVRIVPGRHTYAFMVDDSAFVLDPREPKSRDADLGVETSLMIVDRR